MSRVAEAREGAPWAGCWRLSAPLVSAAGEPRWLVTAGLRLLLRSQGVALTAGEQRLSLGGAEASLLLPLRVLHVCTALIRAGKPAHGCARAAFPPRWQGISAAPNAQLRHFNASAAQQQLSAAVRQKRASCLQLFAARAAPHSPRRSLGCAGARVELLRSLPAAPPARRRPPPPPPVSRPPLTPAADTRPSAAADARSPNHLSEGAPAPRAAWTGARRWAPWRRGS